MRFNTRVSIAEVGFVGASICLRPPRVAIVFPDDVRWRDWAMLALATAGEYWGGGAFILVPYDRTSGDASPFFAEVVRAYDPDHVVSLELPLQLWEDWYPGELKFSGVREEEERLRLIRIAGFGQTDFPAEHARWQVSTWCSPLRVSYAKSDTPTARETITTLKVKNLDRRQDGSLAPAPDRASMSRVAAAGHWRSDIGLLAALRVGVEVVEGSEPPEPTFDSLSWLVRPDGSRAPDDLVRTFRADNVGDPEFWFQGQGLMQVTRGFNADGAALVIGDTGSDFALALAYDRIMGQGTWLSTSLVDDDEAFHRRIRPAVQTQITQLENRAQQLVITSYSIPHDALTELSERLQENEFEFEFEFTVEGHAAREERRRRETVHVRQAEIEGGFTSYVVDEHVGTEVALPVSTDADGSTESLVGLQTPIPTRLLFPDSSGHVPYWYVDVTFARSSTPTARDLPARALLVQDGPFAPVMIRASRAGMTLSPRSMGFVPAGALLMSRIGRPRLRAASMIAWVRAMALKGGLDVRLSDAGRRAELVRSRIGTRQNLLELVGPAYLPLLQAFAQRERRPRPGERDPDTVVVGLDPYLSFFAVQALLPLHDERECMDILDRLLNARLLRRGLILGCEECARPSFVDADRIGQLYECPQCGALNALVSARWKRHTPEPVWFYDLYSNLRELVGANGDVVLMAASELQRTSHTYQDAPELEFVDLETGSPVAEVDVVACVDDRVVLVEAKSNGSFGSRHRKGQAKKLMRVAEVLRADRLVLATTQPEWNPTDVAHLTQVGADAAPFPVQVDVVAGLGRPN